MAARAGLSEAEAEGYDERLPGVWQRIVTALAMGGPEPVAAAPAGGDDARDRGPRTAGPAHPGGHRGGCRARQRGHHGPRWCLHRAAGPGRAPCAAPRTARGTHPIPPDARGGRSRSIPARTRTRCATCAAPSMPGAPGTSSGCSARSGSTRKATDFSVDTGSMGVEVSVDLIELAARRHDPDGFRPMRPADPLP